MIKNPLYFYCSYTSMYGTLHGMYDGNIEECDLADAELNAKECSREVMESYECCMEDVHATVNEQLGYDDTPDFPDEEYLDALEEEIEQNLEYVLFRVTEAGENHIDEMEEDYSEYESFVAAGWLVSPY